MNNCEKSKDIVTKYQSDIINDKELLSKFIKYFDEKSDYDIIHNDQYGEYQPSRYSLKDIFENFLESERIVNLSIDDEITFS